MLEHIIAAAGVEQTADHHIHEEILADATRNTVVATSMEKDAVMIINEHGIYIRTVSGHTKIRLENPTTNLSELINELQRNPKGTFHITAKLDCDARF
jgi:hypothetical protein